MRLLMRLASSLLGLTMLLTTAALADDISNWSATDSLNNRAAPNGWQSGVMLPSQVEPTGRAMMGAIRRFYDTLAPAGVVGGLSKATYAFYTVTTVVGSSSVTLAGASVPASCAGTCYITILGAGPYEQRYIGQITGGSGPNITVSPTPTLNMSAFSTIVYYGADNAATLNAAITKANAAGFPVIVPPGTYLVASPIQCTMINLNNFNQAPPACAGLAGSGATLMAVANMSTSSPVANTVFTIGGYSGGSDFSQFIRNGQFDGAGLTIDCNMIASYGFGMPFFQDSHIGHYNVKNCLTANFHLGSASSPLTSAGAHFHNNSVQRDAFNVPIASISCVSTRANVTTTIDHGITTGRVVHVVNVNSLPGSVTGTGPIELIFENTGARTGILHGVDCSSWVAYTGGGSLNLTMPSASVIHTVTAMTAANPTQITIVPGDLNLTNGQTWCIYGIGSTTSPFVFQQTVPDGCYTISNVGGSGSDGAFHFTVPVNVSATYVGAGVAYQQQSMGSVGVYQDNVSDVEMTQNIITGITYGTDYNPSAGGYDGKYTNNHFYNLTQGWMIAAHRLGGHNALVGEQCDAPLLFCGEYQSYGNSSSGMEVNASAFPWLIDDASWMHRLDACSTCAGAAFNSTTDLTSTADKLFGFSASIRPNEVSNHALAGSVSWGVSIPNYKSFGNSCGANTLYCLPDSDLGTTKLTATPGNPTGTTSTSVVAMGLGASCNIAPVYKTSIFFSISGVITNNTTSDGAYGSVYVGTGSAPSNAGSLSGSTQLNTNMGVLAVTGGGISIPFTWQGTLTGLTLGTTYWFDAGLRAVTGGTASINSVTCTAMEQ